jgi:hypothetical protein
MESVMNSTRDTDQTASAGNGDDFNPQEAAALLDQARRQARRKFCPNPPLLSFLQAIVVLLAYGGIWLSVRGQHPYKGPSGWAITITYLLVFLVIGSAGAAMKRATTGVSGLSRRQMRARLSVLGVAWAAVYVYQGALYHAGVSHAIVYGLYPATAPLMIVGLVGAAIAAGMSDWPSLATTLGVAVVAAISAFGGPRGVWLFMGIGLCLALLATGVATTVRQRA